jgi:hypothetical protein
MPSVSPICRGERAADTHGSDFKRRLLAKKTRVVPGDRRETRDPFRNLFRISSGMDPGSPLRSVRDDTVMDVET